LLGCEPEDLFASAAHERVPVLQPIIDVDDIRRGCDDQIEDVGRRGLFLEEIFLAALRGHHPFT
jgi:hypothetical protein